MAYFDRYDICAAYLALEMDYSGSMGILWERPRNRRAGFNIYSPRCCQVAFQLRRMGFKPGASFNGFRNLSENGKEIYHEAAKRWKLPVIPCCGCADIVMEEYQLYKEHEADCSHDCETDHCDRYEEWLNGETFYNENQHG